MYKRIALSRNLSLKDKIKNIGRYYMISRGVRILRKREFDRVFKLAPEFNTPVEKSIESKHKEYWGVFRRKVNPGTLRLCAKYSGIADPLYIPSEIFNTDIEPTLNPSLSAEFFCLKSFYNHWFGEGVFPHDYLHNIDGEWLDHNLNVISYDAVIEIANNLEYPVVFKPNRDSYGGKNVFFPESREELLEIAKMRQDFLVQEKITQHAFFNKFNPHGINSVRLNVYRSVKDDQLHVVSSALRCGVGGSLDNVSSGGIASGIRQDGKLCGFATDDVGKRYLKHPDTGISFDHKIPDYDDLKRVSLEVASKIFYARIICLDLCYDLEGRWRLIEVNINSTSLMFAQYYGAQFFGEFTEEVREYCIKNHWTMSKNLS